MLFCEEVKGYFQQDHENADLSKNLCIANLELSMRSVMYEVVYATLVFNSSDTSNSFHNSIFVFLD